jgi:uncharacterized protein YdeI (YjbR/CyaY-like superfamily)
VKADIPRIEPAGAAAFRAWLEQYHAKASAVWVVLLKKSTKGPRLDLSEAIDQALCFGWVDSKSMSIDEGRYCVYFSVRNAGSGWSRINKEKIARLADAGLMAPAGLKAVEAAQADGSWTILDGPEAGVVPDDLAAAMDEAGVRDWFESLTPGARKAILTRLVLAKRPATRISRIEKTVADLAEGRSPLE